MTQRGGNSPLHEAAPLAVEIPVASTLFFKSKAARCGKRLLCDRLVSCRAWPPAHARERQRQRRRSGLFFRHPLKRAIGTNGRLLGMFFHTASSWSHAGKNASQPRCLWSKRNESNSAADTSAMDGFCWPPTARLQLRCDSSETAGPCTPPQQLATTCDLSFTSPVLRLSDQPADSRTLLGR